MTILYLNFTIISGPSVKILKLLLLKKTVFYGATIKVKFRLGRIVFYIMCVLCVFKSKQIKIYLSDNVQWYIII